MEYILAVDLGTTAIKVILFQSDGQVISKSTQEYKLLIPTELEVELEVEKYWNAFKKGLVEVLTQAKIDSSKIKSIGISAQGETLILVDKEGGVFYGFTLHHGKAHFIRSILEAIAFAIQRNIDVLEDLGIKVDEIRSLGGGSRSLLWSQIKADVTQRSVYIMENEEAACLGAAMLAGVATGIYPNLKVATKKMVRIKKQVKPNKANMDTYKQGYKRYTSLYNSLIDMFKKY